MEADIDTVNNEVMKATVAYHHGNARAALLRAAAELLEQVGAAGLSLRQVADRAGLSRQAPYNHFDNKEALLAELAGTGFVDLAARMVAGSESASAAERLVTAGESYIAFGQERPALFRLMFGKELVDIRAYPAAQQAADAALGRLSDIISSIDPAADPGDATLVAWSLVHGYTDLCIEVGLEAPQERSRRARLFARTVEALVRS